jgi:hypothetical protein
MRIFGLFLLVNTVTCPLAIAQQVMISDSPSHIAGNPANYSQEQEDEWLQPWDDGPEQQQPDAVGFSQQIGRMGALSVQGSLNPDAPRMSVGQAYRGGGRGCLKALESRVESDDFQTLFSVGGTAALLRHEQGIVAARALAGYALRHRDVNEDSYHYTVDLYGARPIMSGRHWVKAGWFIDEEEEFRKTGPELGLLLFADRRTPLTVDIAYGFGLQGEQLVGIELVEAAEDDVQLRIGTILGNRLHVGGTVQYLDYDPFGVVDGNEVWEAGAFLSAPLRCGRIQLDGTAGELGASGMLRFVWLPGGGNIFQPVPTRGGCGCASACVPEAWLSAPVSRRTGIRVRRHGNAGAGPLFGLTVANVILNLNVDAGAPGLNIDDPDEAEIEIEVENEGGLIRDLDVVGFLLFDGLNSGSNVGPFSVSPGGGRARINTDPNVGPGLVTQLSYETTFRAPNGQTRILRAVFAPGSTNGATPISVTIL